MIGLPMIAHGNLAVFFRGPESVTAIESLQVTPEIDSVMQYAGGFPYSRCEVDEYGFVHATLEGLGGNDATRIVEHFRGKASEDARRRILILGYGGDKDDRDRNVFHVLLDSGYHDMTDLNALLRGAVVFRDGDEIDHTRPPVAPSDWKPSKADKISTEDCTAFIVDFQRRNPNLENSRFEVDQTLQIGAAEKMDEDNKSDFVRIHEPKAWKRLYKRGADHEENASRRGDTFKHFRDGDDADGPTGVVAGPEIKAVRGFMFDRLDGQIAYEVLETRDGRLLLGEYIGD